MTGADRILIEKLQTSVYKIPTDLPEADGTLKWTSTTLVIVEIFAGGKQGLGYTYAHEAAGIVIERTFKSLVENHDAMDIQRITSSLLHALRNDGCCGIGMMAVSAVDNALWDLKAKLLEMPLCKLLGQIKDDMLIYGSGGFTSYSERQLADQLGGWAAEGLRFVKMKIGADPQQDVGRIRVAREAIGRQTGLFVDANGAFTVKTSLQKAEKFSEYNVSWYEEPVASENLKGLRFIRDHLPDGLRVAAGEYGYTLSYFNRMLEAGAVDILQADATRCGGISYYLKAGHLAESLEIPFSSHCAPAVHLHASVALSSFYVGEYFHDHVRIENMLFDGTITPTNGTLKPDTSRPGIGLGLKKQDAEKFKM